jgi:hypothetical protein
MSIFKTYTNESGTDFVVKNNTLWIPADPMNPDYLEYVQWLFDGNTAEEWQPDMEEGN